MTTFVVWKEMWWRRMKFFQLCFVCGVKTKKASKRKFVNFFYCEMVEWEWECGQRAAWVELERRHKVNVTRSWKAQSFFCVWKQKRNFFVTFLFISAKVHRWSGRSCVVKQSPTADVGIRRRKCLITQDVAINDEEEPMKVLYSTRASFFRVID